MTISKEKAIKKAFLNKLKEKLESTIKVYKEKPSLTPLMELFAVRDMNNDYCNT